MTKMQWSDIKDGRLAVIQNKTKSMIRIPLDLSIKKLAIKLNSVLDRLNSLNEGCQEIVGGRKPSTLAKNYNKARDGSGIKCNECPPPFHQLRSGSGRWYSDEKEAEFAHKLLAHKSATVTQK